MVNGFVRLVKKIIIATLMAGMLDLGVSAATSLQDATNWPLLGIVAAIVIVFFGIVIAAFSGGGSSNGTMGPK